MDHSLEAARSAQAALSDARIAAAFRWLIGLTLAGMVLWILGDVLLVAFAALLIAVALDGAGRALERATGLGRKRGVLLVFFLVLAGIIATASFAGPELVRQGEQLVEAVRDQAGQIRGALEGSGLGRMFEQVFGQGNRSGGAVLQGFAGAAFSTFGLLGTVAIIFVAGLYLALEPAIYRKGSRRLIPPRERARFDEILDETGHTLRRWMLGRLIDMAILASLVYAGLLILGIPLAFVLALLAGLLNFVPYIGAIASAIPALLVAGSEGWNTVLWVGALFAIVQTVEGNLIEPMIERRTVSLPPALTVFSQTLFGALFGLAGLILAPALAATLLTITRMALVEDVIEGGTQDSDK